MLNEFLYIIKQPLIQGGCDFIRLLFKPQIGTNSKNILKRQHLGKTFSRVLPFLTKGTLFRRIIFSLFC